MEIKKILIFWFKNIRKHEVLFYEKAKHLYMKPSHDD